MTLAAIGRARDEPEALLFDQYWNRASRIGPGLGFGGFELSVIEPSRRASAGARLNEEAERLQRRSPEDAHLIVLDELGRSLTSEAFAQYLAAVRDRNIADVVFVIGGPDGVAAELRNSAQMRIAFGAQTWPHLLVRAMLAEQLYRAMTILSGHPYHRRRI